MSCKLWLPIFLNEQRSTIYQAKAVIARRHDEAMTVSAWEKVVKCFKIVLKQTCSLVARATSEAIC